MPFKYVAVKDTKNGEDGDACAFNSAILAEGVKGVRCISVTLPSAGEASDYGNYIPWGCHFSIVENYANGARNYFVRTGEFKVVGYLIVRPLTNDEVDAMADRMTGGNNA